MAITAKTYFAIIPEWLLDADVNPRAVVLYGILRRYADKGGHCHPRRNTIADRLRCTESTLARLLQELADVGAVIITRRFGEDGSQLANDYEVLDQQREMVPTLPMDGEGGSPQMGRQEPESFEPDSASNEAGATPLCGGAPVQELLADYVDQAHARGVTPTPRLRGAWGGVVKRLLADGVPEDDVRIALRWAAEENKLPSALAGLVMDVQAKRHERGLANGSLAR